MARTANRLTAKAVEKTREAGMHNDGDGLYLRVTDTGTKSWLFRFKIAGKARAMGLGPFPQTTLAEAREKAADARKQLASGNDPLEVRNAVAPRKAVTFAEAATAYIEAHQSKWRSDKSLARWRRFERYAGAAFGEKAAGAVSTDDVLELLKPLWSAKPETAAKLREAVENILDFAKVKKWRDGENPARWRGHLNHLLPARNRRLTVKHHAALPWPELPAFMSDLRSRDALAARALEITILCNTRTSETLQAPRSEIAGDLWIIPPGRTKNGKEHRVPLTSRAVAIFAALPVRGDYIFPGFRDGRPLSGMAMEMLLRRMGRNDITVHGFRSTFRDWAAEETNYPREIVELCLSHDISSEVERAYRRSDLLTKRRELLNLWASYALSVC